MRWTRGKAGASYRLHYSLCTSDTFFGPTLTRAAHGRTARLRRPNRLPQHLHQLYTAVRLSRPGRTCRTQEFPAPSRRWYAPSMDERRGPNPFVPGWGRTPPYLAGRSDEQRKLLDLFAYLEHGEGAPRGAILSGPRGNGKTALLRWFQREIDAPDAPCDVVWLTPSEIADLDQLATGLVPPSRFTALRPDTLSFSVGIGRLGWELGGHSRSLTLLLAARCKRKPLVLLLDEAHTLPLQAGQALLNASQTVSAEAPFLLVMAGTPGLQRHLNEMSATFWSRGEKMGIGRLDPEASALALTRPMLDAQPPITFDDDALDSRCRGKPTLSVLPATLGFGAVVRSPDDAPHTHRPCACRASGRGLRRSSGPPTTKIGARNLSGRNCCRSQRASPANFPLGRRFAATN